MHQQISYMTNNDRIIEISKRLGMSHISSNVSCLPILEHIHAKKKPGDIVILDNAHAHLAHLIVKQTDQVKNGNFTSAIFTDKDMDLDSKIEEIVEAHGIHCDRKAGCDASGGSLGHGIGIAIGYAMADPKRDVYVTVSDGSMQEGSNWEALRIADQLGLQNLHIHCNFNNYTALEEVDGRGIYEKMRHHAPWIHIVYWKTDNGEGFDGVEGHYKKP